jgi:hypothetical protein
LFLLIVLQLIFCKASTAQNIQQSINNNISLPYEEVIEYYKSLDAKYASGKLLTRGLTDSGLPLNVFLISSDQSFDAKKIREQGKLVLLINNGIHPGEPDGIDASIKLAEELLSNEKTLPSDIVICIIPVYNIDGALNRGCCSRANQQGPQLYGFRGNARNLDLNRDFIKCDSENAKSFIKIFQEFNPDVFVDTHVSDGADYQYVMTLISTQHNKLGGPAGEFLHKNMTPSLFAKMQKAGHEMSTYVNTQKYDDTPEKGILSFLESPRFASGYAALFSTFGFVAETHMLKPFPQRVEATLQLLKSIVEYCTENSKGIKNARREQTEFLLQQKELPLNWQVDSLQWKTIPFKGFEAVYRNSTVTGLPQLYYDRSKPYTREIRFYDEFKPTKVSVAPLYYIIPQAWKNIVEIMELSNVQFERLTNDTVLEVESYTITDFKTGKEPYEGHYVHTSTELSTSTTKINYLKGDYIVPVDQTAKRFIVETLEPAAPDSWFSWGFFDSILQQKEWFSAYVFDSVAAKILETDTTVKQLFEKKKAEDKMFAADSFAQLYFIYRNSKWFEDFRRYPVARFNGSL